VRPRLGCEERRAGVPPREPSRRARDREAADERVPGAARCRGDRDRDEAVEKAVAVAAASAVPALGGRDRSPAAVARGKVDLRRDALAVHPDLPPVLAAADLEHGDPLRLSGRKPGCDLVVRRRHVRQRQLVVEAAPRCRREAAEPDLQPLVGSVRALLRPADADPACDVAGDDAERRQRRDRRADSVCVARGFNAGIRVAAGPARQGVAAVDAGTREAHSQEERAQAESHALPGIGGHPSIAAPSIE